MRTLESRLNEVEKVLNTGVEGLPCLIYVSRDTDDEQTERQAKIRAYEEYKAQNVGNYPQLASMDLADFEGSENVTVHFKITDFSRGATV